MKIILDSRFELIKDPWRFILDNFSVGLAKRDQKTIYTPTHTHTHSTHVGVFRFVLFHQLGSMFSDANNKHLLLAHFWNLQSLSPIVRLSLFGPCFRFICSFRVEGDDQLNKYVWMKIENKHANNDWTERNRKTKNKTETKFHDRSADTRQLIYYYTTVSLCTWSVFLLLHYNWFLVNRSFKQSILFDRILSWPQVVG